MKGPNCLYLSMQWLSTTYPVQSIIHLLKKKLYICRCAISLHFVNTSTEYPTSQKKKTEYPSVILLAINQYACIDSTLATEESLGEAIRSTRSKVSSREKYSSTSLSR